MATVTVFTSSVPGLPCNWDVDTGCCTEWATYSPAVQTAAAEFGALSIWAATGRRFGACLRTVRPYSKDQGTDYAWISGMFWQEGMWLPYIMDGAWHIGGSIHDHQRRPKNQVWLTPPVSGIVQVKLSDGTILDPSTYRVDDYQWLVRQGPNLDATPITATNGGLPSRNDYNFPVSGPLAPATQDPPVWQVSYLWGRAVPGILSRAAGELACEWARNCVGATCRLPQRVTSIARQGVTVSLADVDQLLQNGLTGITTVDAVIQRFNPGRLPSRMQIASPDLPSVRQTTWGQG